MQKTVIQWLSIGLFAAVLLWGAWTLLAYLGVPVHGAVLLPDGVFASLGTLCNGNEFLCRGAYGFFPFLLHTFRREPVFFWYLVLSLGVYAGFLVYRFVRSGRLDIHGTFKPWHLTLLFVAAAWVIFSCLMHMQSGNVAVNILVAPHPDVYQNAGPESLAELQKNFDALNERGCLKPVGTYGAAKAYKVSAICFQTSFFTRVVPAMVLAFLFLFELLVLGRFALRLLKIRPERLLTESLLSIGAGVSLWIMILWTAAILHIFVWALGWALVLAVPVLALRDSRYWIEKFFRASWEVNERWWSPRVVLMWLLISYLAFNFINVVRPFPIGWDDLGSYLNRPHLLVSYGHFIFSMASFQWEYLTALGYLLFGFNSWFGATASLIINWTEGLLAAALLFGFGNVFFGRKHGLVAATLYTVLPLVGHFSFADMKIDNAVFFMGALSVFTLFLWLFKPTPGGEGEDPLYCSMKLVALAGAFIGMAFGMKVTAIMVLMSLGAVLLGATMHWVAFLGVASLALAVFAARGALPIISILERLNFAPGPNAPIVSATLLAVLGLLFLGVGAFKAHDRLRATLKAVLFFAAGLVIAVLPWIMYNNLQVGSFIPKLALGVPNTITPTIDLYGYFPNTKENVYRLPADLAIKQSDPHCQATGAVEELGRYWGTRQGWEHYLTLPWRTVMNIDSVGYYVTTIPILLLFPLVFLLPFFWSVGGRFLRWLTLGTIFVLLEWMFMANGIPWYGIGVFLGLVLCLEALVARSPDTLNRTVASAFIGFSILIGVSMRLWQFDSQRNLFEYALGKVSAEALRERTIPYYDDVTDIALQRTASMPDRPMLYRVGTFIPYFIPKNLEIIGATDHQLDLFNCLYQERDPVLTLKRLQSLGFNSIIFDTNTATIEKDANGSLHQKVNAFVDFINTPGLGMRLVVNDPSAGIAYILLP